MRLNLKSVAVLGALTFPAAGLPLQSLAQEAEVGIRDYKFEPAELKVKVGATVKWTNNEKRASHSVLFTGPEGLESERLFPGESWQRRFDRPGVYAYRCGPHPEMKGRIEVSE